MLAERRIFGDLGDFPLFVAQLRSLLERLESTGVRAVLADELAERRISAALPPPLEADTSA